MVDSDYIRTQSVRLMPPSTGNEKTLAALLAYWSRTSCTKQCLIEKLPDYTHCLTHCLEADLQMIQEQSSLILKTIEGFECSIKQTIRRAWLHSDHSPKDYDVVIVVRVRHEVTPHEDPCDSFLHDAVIRSELNKTLIDI